VLGASFFLGGLKHHIQEYNRATARMKRVLVTIAPAIEPFTSAYSPARRAAAAMTSSVRFPSVALSNPPTVIAGLFRNRFGSTTKQAGKWHDREHREDEQQRVRGGDKSRGHQCHRHKSQQPEHAVVPELFEQRVHRSTFAFGTQKTSVCSLVIDMAQCHPGLAL
jgi:hypothetical protein